MVLTKKEEEMKILTEDEFIARFKPEEEEPGVVYRQRDGRDRRDRAAIKKALKERRLWTMVDTDEGVALLQGAHIVNYLFHVICKVPWKKGEKIEIEMDEIEMDEIDEEGG